MTRRVDPEFVAPRVLRSKCGQRGSALIITLVLLLVITIIGIAGMAATVLQERMAGSLQNRAQVFEATESVLKRCTKTVLNGDNRPNGHVSADILADFMSGQTVSPAHATVYAPSSLGSGLSAQGQSGYQMACLIEFGGPVDATRVGDSLRRPAVSGSLVSYTVTARGARVAPSTTGTQRPSVILETRVVLRR